MDISSKDYSQMVKKASPPSKHLKNCIMAFLFGGFICSLGEAFFQIYQKLNIGEENSRMLASVTLIFLAALLTGLKVFDNIAKVAGAGTLVPITGFANSVVSPAIEFKKEGFVLGVGANMFKIAGPVIVYGTIASVIYGVVYWITTLL
ncbi:MAG: stage V sporulation protein AC [Acutalibacteraceae bacterium]|nr:stage V sporulation protein AC [Acutalibacteraceae bacterium]